jgi:magnesium-transporting ATPase (P-type)
VLWVNMVTSVALGLVISFEPHEGDVMQRPPRSIDRPIVTPFGIWRILFVGATLVLYTLAAFFWMTSQGASVQMARTAAVNAITMGQVFYLLNSRSLINSALSLRAHRGNRYLWYGIGAVVVLQILFTYTPPFHAIFETESLPLVAWLWLVVGAILFFLVVEIEKLVIRSIPALKSSVNPQQRQVSARTYPKA